MTLKNFSIKDPWWEIIILTGSFVVLGFVVMFAFHAYRGVEREMAVQFNREQQLLAQQIATGIQQHMSDIANVLHLSTNLPGLQHNDTQTIQDAVGDAYMSLKTKVAFVFWEDRDGNLIYHYPEDAMSGLVGKNYSFRQYFRMASELGVPFASNIITIGGESYPDIPNRFESFIISYPAHDAAGNFAGLIGCVIDLPSITAQHIVPIRPSTSSYAWLIDDTGIILFHPDPHMTGRNINDVILEMERQGLDTSGIRAVRQGMELKNDGMYEYIFPHYPAPQPVKKLLAFSSAHFLNKRWITVVTSPYSEVIALMSGTFRNTTILGSASVALVIIATIVALRINRDRARAHERNKWAERILVAHRRLETVFNAMPHYMAMIDAAFVIVDINQMYCDLYGRDRRDFIDKHCLVDFEPAERICHTDLLEACFKTGQVISDRERRIEIHGKPYLFDVSCIPLLGARGEVEHVIQYAMDMTDKKVLTEKLIQAEKLAAVGQMSAHVAHEIRNPLTSVMLHSELLAEEMEEGGNSEADEIVKIIRDEVDRLARITEEYLAYARLPRPRIQSVDPAEEVADAIRIMRPELERGQIEVSIITEDIPGTIMIDRGQFRQVLINLIKNAAEAMPAGGRLEISLAGIDGDFILKVKDTGSGIPADLTRRIFDPYFTTKENGTGLGLALVQYIANAHEGWVGVESTMNEGATFSFSVPVEAGKNRPKGVIE